MSKGQNVLSALLESDGLMAGMTRVCSPLIVATDTAIEGGIIPTLGGG